MKKLILYLLFLSFLFLNSKNLFGQDFASISKQFDTYHSGALQEKLYAQTDKNSYLAGELMWFKLYNVDASFHKPLDISKVVYVEILDKDHTSLVQTKIAMEKGTGDGSVVLPQTLNSGNYFFRAYTNWMKNFDADFYFEKAITIINTVKADAQSVLPGANPSFDIQFFPEGGNFVNGIESTVGFRVVDQYGNGSNVAGFVLDNNNDTVANFETLKFGIGSFHFLPQSGKSYRAILNLPGAFSLARELPKAYEQGYVMHIDKASDGKVQVRIKSSANFNNSNLYLFIHSGQHVRDARTVTLTNGVADLVVDDTRLDEGISVFTLFDENKKPVCERLFFKRPGRQLLINATPDQQQYEARKKINIQVGANDIAEKSKEINMSLSVFKLDSSYNSGQQNIQTYLWLSSDLKGAIESPTYYLNNTDAEADKALDNLMLTHGWRRFKWDDVLLGKKQEFSYLPEYEGHIVSGVVTNKGSGAPAAGTESFFAVPDSLFQFYTGLSDEKGRVNFYTKNFFGPHEVFAQGGGRNRNFNITIRSPFSETYSSRGLPHFSLASVSGQALQAGSISMQVQNIFAADKLNRFSYAAIDTSLFYQPTMTYLLDNYVRFPTMEEVLREYVREVAVIKQNNTLTLESGRRDANGIVYRYEPLVLVDGVPLLDNPNKIFDYDPLKIKELQVVNRKYFLGASNFEGILSFRTYTGRPEDVKVDVNAAVLDYEGLQLQREFFAPLYETPTQVSSRLPDFRNVLYWNPKIRFDGAGKKEFSFYSSDLPGKYMVVIEGLSDNGSAGTKTFTIDVVNPLFTQK